MMISTHELDDIADALLDVRHLLFALERVSDNEAIPAAQRAALVTLTGKVRENIIDARSSVLGLYSAEKGRAA